LPDVFAVFDFAFAFVPAGFRAAVFFAVFFAISNLVSSRAG
jgi:hypothetical protein